VKHNGKVTSRCGVQQNTGLVNYSVRTFRMMFAMGAFSVRSSLDHNTTLSQLTSALKCLGKELTIDIGEAA